MRQSAKTSSMQKYRTAKEEILQRLLGNNELENWSLPSNFTPLLHYQRKEKFHLFPYLIFCATLYLNLKVWTDLQTDFDNKTQGICMKV